MIPISLIRTNITGMIANTMDKVYRFFVGKGRADETVKGAHFQHYGFRSWPPAGTDIITLQQGNLNVGIAENESTLSSIRPEYLQNEGDVLIYQGVQGGVPSSAIALWKDGTGSENIFLELNTSGTLSLQSVLTLKIESSEDNITMKVGDGKKVYMAAKSKSVTFALATGYHTHQVVCPSGGGTVLSSLPMANPATPTFPPVTENLEAT